MISRWQIGAMAGLLGVACTAHAQSFHKCTVQGSTTYQQAACAAPQPHENTLRKCVGPKGHVSIQNDPCPVGQRTAWVRGTEPEVMTPERRQRLAEHARQRDANSRYLSHLAGTDAQPRRRTYINSVSSRTQSKSDRCAAAKAHRESVLKTVGLHRTFDLLRSLNDQVFDACK